MWTPERVNDFMKDFGYKISVAGNEIRDLHNLLHKEEELLGLAEGYLNKVHGNIVNGHGIVIATNKRIIFFRKSLFGTVTKEEVPINKVSSVSYRKGFFHSSIAVTTSNNEAVIDRCDKFIGEKFVNVIQVLISDLDNKSTTANNNPHPTKSEKKDQFNGLEILEKLFDLKQKGIITEEEFLYQKAKILR